MNERGKVKRCCRLRFSNRMVVWIREGFNGGRVGKERERERGKSG